MYNIHNIEERIPKTMYSSNLAMAESIFFGGKSTWLW